MNVMLLPLAPEPMATTPAPDPARLLEERATLRQDTAALRTDNAARLVESAVLHERIRELEPRLGQTSANSSRPPSSDLPQAVAKRRPPPIGRKRGEQPGHRGACWALLPVEEVPEVIAVLPKACRHCGEPLPASAACCRDRVWRHQVVELLPLAVQATKYQKLARRCPRCGRLLRRGQASPDRRAAGLCRELTKWWPTLWTFSRVEGIEPTTNVVEPAPRPAVLWRKGSFGSDSEAGSRFVERLLTVVATCRQQGRQLLDFLVTAGEAALGGNPARSLLTVPQAD